MSSTKNLEYQKTSFLNKSNSNFIENMYLRFIKNDSSLPEDWREYFHALNENIEDVINEIDGPSWSVNKVSIDNEKLTNNKLVESDQELEKQKIDSIYK